MLPSTMPATDRSCARLLALLALFLSAHGQALGAATLRVGPNEPLARIADGARKAKDGDVVEILPGEYRGDVAVWEQRSLTIRGIGERPVLIADGKSAEGKTWPENELTLRHNTLISDNLKGAWFMRMHEDKSSTPPKVRADNNLTVGPGAFTLAARGEFHGNFPALPIGARPLASPAKWAPGALQTTHP